MERRSARLIVNTAGGTAGKDAKTYKAALPSSWIHALGLSDENRDMELSFDGDSITISVPETYDSFGINRNLWMIIAWYRSNGSAAAS